MAALEGAAVMANRSFMSNAVGTQDHGRSGDVAAFRKRSARAGHAERLHETMKIRIRNAVSEDLPAIVALLKHLDVGEDKDLSLRRARAIFERARRYPWYRIYIAVAPDRNIVGIFALLIIEGLAHGGAPHGLVEDVVVNPQWRGRGIGRRMMRYAMQRCRAAGCYKLALSSHLSRLKTHGFYESLGFAKHGYSFLAL